MHTDAPDSMVLASPLQLLQILAKGKLTLLLVSLLAVGAAAGYVVYLAPKIYTATGRLMIEAAPNIYPRSPALADIRTVEEAVVLSQSEALASRDLMGHVYDRLGNEGFAFEVPYEVALEGRASADIAEAKRAAAIGQMLEVLEVTVSKDSHVVNAKYSDKNPALANRALTILFDEYLKREIDRRGAANRAAREQYEARLAAIRVELEQVNKHISAEVTGSRLYIAGRNTVLSSSIAAVSQELNDLQAQIAKVSSRMKVGRDAASRKDWVTAARIMDTPTMRSLLQSELDIELDARTGGSGSRTLLHPDNTVMRSKIDSIHALMKDEMKGALDALSEGLAQLHDQKKITEERLATLVASTSNEQQGAVSVEQLKKNAAELREMYGVVLERIYDTNVSPTPDAWTMETPNVSSLPTSPRVGITLASSAVFGLLIGSLLVMWRETRRRSVKTALLFDDSRASQASPAIWSLPRLRPGLLPGERTRARLDSPATRTWCETLRAIGYGLAQRSSSRSGVTVAVLSAQSGEGKTMLALSLAQQLAQDGYRVLLVDADLRKPDVHNLTGLGLRGSLWELLKSAPDWEDIVQIDESSGLHVVAPLEPTVPPTSFFREGRMRELLDSAKGGYDFTILDTSPVLLVGDSQVVMNYVDCAMFVSSEQTSAVHARQALQQLSFPLSKLQGVVRMGHNAGALSYPGYR